MKGLSIVPTDKEMAKKLETVEEALKNHHTSTLRNSPPVTSKSTSGTREAVSPPKSDYKNPALASGSQNGDKDEEENEIIRGYKQTSDGKITTYFNNELDDNTKALIGDIAPKKLDPASQAPATVPSSVSVWNTAGNFLFLQKLQT